MTTTTTVASWRTVAATVTGRGHAEREEPGQDRFFTSTRADGTVVIAVADGAGSATRGGDAAEIAVRAAANHAADGAQPWEAIATARRHVVDAGDARDWATTLIVCTIGASHLAAAQVGDGALVLARGSDIMVVSPRPGEYLNETVMLTSRDWCEEMAVGCWSADDVTAVAVMTDGLAPVAFDLVTWQAHVPFFRPLFEFAAGAIPDEGELRAFLASDRLAARTDDDITLVLAVPAR